MIIEEEQKGNNRADYGKYILKGLSPLLCKRFGKGFSVTNLKQMRQFYTIYSRDQIGQTLSDQFKNLPTVDTGRKFFLNWSHYLQLMRIINVDERHFYEIESAKNDWSLSELKRQLNSSLYERLALSKLFQLDYETRPGSKAFLQHPEDEANNYIDFYYMHEAYSTFEAWFEACERQHTFDKNDFRSKIKFHTKVYQIWRLFGRQRPRYL